MKKLKSFGKVLSKSEQMRIMGGYPPGGSCGENQYWLVCTTPNGTESWCRSSMSGNASDVCSGIYPAYGSSVSGNWAPVVIIQA